MWTEYLLNIGLSPDQAKVYTSLLELGAVTAKKASLSSGLKRGLVYKILDQLISHGLVEKRAQGRETTLFLPTHPARLKHIAERKRIETENAEKSLTDVLGQLTSQYNLVTHRPNVQFFEGVDGAKKVAFDALDAEYDEILEYIDNENVHKYVPELNKDYIATRKRLGIKKRMLCVDTPFARERIKQFDPNLTDVRITQAKFGSAVMQIYGNKISTVTLEPDRMIGIIIEDKAVTAMHRSIFEVMWNQAKKVN